MTIILKHLSIKSMNGNAQTKGHSCGIPSVLEVRRMSVGKTIGDG